MTTPIGSVMVEAAVETIDVAAEAAVEGASVALETATVVIETIASEGGGIMKPILIGTAIIVAVAGVGYGAWKSRHWVSKKWNDRKLAKAASAAAA